MKHLMIDLETMGNKSNAAICSIAAVQFDLTTGETGWSFKENISLDSCVRKGLKIEPSTLEWWLKQDKKAQDSLFFRVTTLEKALLEFCAFFQSMSIECVWGNSARFDLGLLENAFNAVGMDVPWKYWNERDVRTLVSFAPEVKKEMPFDGVKHDPIMDCLHQIKYCSAIYQKIFN